MQTLKQSESGLQPTANARPADASCTMETALKWNGMAKQDSLSFAVYAMGWGRQDTSRWTA